MGCRAERRPGFRPPGRDPRGKELQLLHPEAGAGDAAHGDPFLPGRGPVRRSRPAGAGLAAAAGFSSGSVPRRMRSSLERCVGLPAAGRPGPGFPIATKVATSSTTVTAIKVSCQPGMPPVAGGWTWAGGGRCVFQPGGRGRGVASAAGAAARDASTALVSTARMRAGQRMARMGIMAVSWWLLPLLAVAMVFTTHHSPHNCPYKSVALGLFRRGRPPGRVLGGGRRADD